MRLRLYGRFVAALLGAVLAEPHAVSAQSPAPNTGRSVDVMVDRSVDCTQSVEECRTADVPRESDQGTLVATPTANATPKPTTKPRRYKHFFVGDYIFNPKVYNEFSPGNSGNGGSYSARSAVEFRSFGLAWMLEGNYRSYAYPHRSGITAAEFAASIDGNPCPHGALPAALTPAAGDQGCVTVVGAFGQLPVPSFTARDTDLDARLGVMIAGPRIYIGVGYLHREENYGYPKQNGFGIGTEKLPDLEHASSVYGSVWYYPSVVGNFTYPAGSPRALVGTTVSLQQRSLKYQIGATRNLGNSRLFLDASFLGETIRVKYPAPSDASNAAGYIGLGFKF
jgi:hypothetical protein